MNSQDAITPARTSRQLVAGAIDGLVCVLLFAIGFAIAVPTLHHDEAPEQITRFVFWPMIATVLNMWYARAELGRGTLGQKVARVQRVRSDGSAQQATGGESICHHCCSSPMALL